MFNMIPSAVFSVDQKKNITNWNRQAEIITGYSREEVIGKSCRSFALTPCLEKCGLFSSEITKPIFGKECIIRAKCGKALIIRKNVDYLRDHNNEIVGGIESFEDITEQKNLEKQFAQNRDSFFNIVERNDVGILILNSERTVVFANIASCLLLQTPQEKILGSKPIIPDVDSAPQNITIRRKDKTIGTGEMHTVDTQWEGNKAMMVLIRDVTEWNRLQEQLTNEKEQADNANFEKTQFISCMSHEMRTPLNVIIGLADELKEAQMAEEQKKHIDVISKAADGLLLIINQILDLSKIEAGIIELEEKEFDLKQMIINVEKILLPMAINKGLSLIIDVPELKNVLYVGDEVKLTQVLINIVANAIKFTKIGSVKIVLTLFRELDESADFQISVFDTGIGIAKENISKVFEPFVQEDISTSRLYGGTGLGLAICRRLVKLMNGDIGCDSEPGVGSHFYFSVPLKKSKLNPNEFELENQQGVHFDHAVAGIKHRNILLIDDSEDNVLLVQLFLKNTGCYLDVAYSGEQGVEMFRAKRYDLILMDLQMPGMDGCAATNNIRIWEKEHGVSHVSILAITASALDFERRKAIAAGCDDCLSKPIKKKILLDSVASFINRQCGHNLKK